MISVKYKYKTGFYYNGKCNNESQQQVYLNYTQINIVQNTG